MRFPGTDEWHDSTNSAILPCGLIDVNVCPEGFPNPGQDGYPTELSSNIRCGRDPQSDGRSESLGSFDDTSRNEDDDATCVSSGKTGSNEDAIRESLRDARKHEGPRISSIEAKPNCADRVHGPDLPNCNRNQVIALTAPLVPIQVVTKEDEHLNWEEEKKQWIMAAGVSTPADLKRKIADQCRVNAPNETSVKKLTDHLAVVKTLLVTIHDMDRDILKLKRRCQRRTKRRKRARRGGPSAECCCVPSNTRESVTERPIEHGGGSLLDPVIMNCFRSLIKSSA